MVVSRKALEQADSGESLILPVALQRARRAEGLQRHGKASQGLIRDWKHVVSSPGEVRERRL